MEARARKSGLKLLNSTTFPAHKSQYRSRKEPGPHTGPGSVDCPPLRWLRNVVRHVVHVRCKPGGLRAVPLGEGDTVTNAQRILERGAGNRRALHDEGVGRSEVDPEVAGDGGLN